VKTASDTTLIYLTGSSKKNASLENYFYYSIKI